MQKEIVQKYVNMRNTNSFDIRVFWEMYQTEGGYIKNIQDFSKHFLHEVQIIEGMEIIVNRDINLILLGVDSKLGLTSLHDKNGQFIKIIN